MQEIAGYDDYPQWRAYQAHFPPAMRVTPEIMPVEEAWRWRGLDVHIDRMRVPNPRLKVLVLHGAGAYGRVMAPAAVIARKHGMEALAPDLPGYGMTAVPNSRWDYPLWIDCVCDLVAEEQRRSSTPIVLFGVSLGGLLAYQVATRVPVAGVIATTLADTREPEVRRGFAKFDWLGTAGLWLLDRLSFLLDPLPLPMAWMSKMSAISNTPAISKLVMEDRRGGGNWVPARFLRTLMSTDPAIEPEEFDRCPVLLAHPGDDHMTDIAFSRRFFDRLASDKKMVVLEGASHMPTERPGLAQLEREVLTFLDALAE